MFGTVLNPLAGHHPRTPRSGGRGGSSPVGVAYTRSDLRRVRHQPHQLAYRLVRAAIGNLETLSTLRTASVEYATAKLTNTSVLSARYVEERVTSFKSFCKRRRVSLSDRTYHRRPLAFIRQNRMDFSQALSEISVPRALEANLSANGSVSQVPNRHVIHRFEHLSSKSGDGADICAIFARAQI